MVEFYRTWPDIFTHNVMFMLEAMTFKVTVQCQCPSTSQNIVPRDLNVQAWTNIYHRHNPEGIWHGINLDYVEHEVNNKQHFLFEKSVILTSNGNFRYTYRVKDTLVENSWVWRGGYGQDGTVEVRPPSNDRWTHGPNYDHIFGSVYLGNFIAASMADKLDFTAVLNVADNLDIAESRFEKLVLYKKIPMVDGACNVIPTHLIREAVMWLREHDFPESKILVNCRAGIGRAGSTVVAYVFACNKYMTYEDAYNFVFSKRFVYPHRGLKEQLYSLCPRCS